MSKKIFIIALTIISAFLIVGTVNYSRAATKIDQVTGRDGDTRDRIQVNAEVTAVDGSHLTFKDMDTSKEYRTGIGPNWFSGAYNVGDKITIEGVETDGETAKQKNHNFQIMKINDKVLRESFEGKPGWAGKGEKGQGIDQGQGQKKNFVDVNGDGVCDNKK